MRQRYRHNKTSVTLINYHFVWIAKRRRKVLTGAIAERLRVLLEEVLPTLDCILLDVAIRPDYVHLFVSAPPTLAPDQIMFRVKGYTARSLRKEFSALLKLPSLWTRSYLCSTAGVVSSATIQRYIAEQMAQERTGRRAANAARRASRDPPSLRE